MPVPSEQREPIELYFWPTPNGIKISILLEELEVPYAVRFVNIGKGEQFQPEFLAISPNNRIPAIVDPEGPDGRPISIFESGAIMTYLADKFGRFRGSTRRQQIAVDQWLFWQVANVGPAFGQNGHFRTHAPEKLPYAIARFGSEVHRLYRILDQRLKDWKYIAGDYSIADMALFGWIRNWDIRGVDIVEFRHVQVWHDRLAARPAVARGAAIKAPQVLELANNSTAQRILFGQR